MATTATFNYRRPFDEVATMLAKLPVVEGQEPITLASLNDLSGDHESREKVFTALRESGAFFTETEKSVLSLRDHPLTLDQGGATLVSAPSAVDFAGAEFRDAGLSKITSEYSMMPSHLAYYAEIEALAHDLLGENVVHAFCTSHIIRDSNGTGAVTAGDDAAGPIKTVHNDFTDEYGSVTYERLSTHPSKGSRFHRAQLKKAKGLEFTAEELEDYRLVVLNTWRPINPEPLRREPLAVCDNRTIQRTDLMEVRTGIGQNDDDPEEDFALEVFMSLPNEEHQWHYVDEFTNQELMVFKTYDSDMHPFVPTMHSAFNLPDQDGQPLRESVEARITCLLKRTPEEKAIFEARQAAALTSSPMDVLRARPELLAEISEKIRADPTSAPQVIMGLMGTEPEIAKAIAGNQDEFKALLMEGASKL